MPQVRIIASSDKAKQKRQYREFFYSPDRGDFMVIATMRGGDVHVLGQGMSLADMASALLAAAKGLAFARKMDDRLVLRAEGIGVTLNPGSTPIMGKAVAPAHKTAPDGTLIPPDGETFLRCGECEAPGFFITQQVDGLAIGRAICARCGNELVMHRHFGGEARA
jgi:hypothetical protein